MKKITLIVLVLLAIVVACWLVVINPHPAPPKSIDFTIGPTYFSNGFPQKVSVVISNASDYSVLYYGGFGIPHFDLAYLTNGIWGHDFVWTPGGGPGVLLPHNIVTSSIEVPSGATTFKVGLDYASLTWRGKIAWFFGGHYPMFGREAGLFLHQDVKKRSKTEWSNEYCFTNCFANGKPIPK